jgi:hypothetical protein
LTGKAGAVRRPTVVRTAGVLLATVPLLAVAGPWRAHEGNSPGWRWLTPAERVEHQRRLRAFDRLADCKAYLAGHHALIAARARQAGESFTPQSPDTCDRLRAEGRLR